MSKTAWVAGATGTAGYSLTRYLSKEKGWRVIALSRRISKDSFTESNVIPIAADLLSPETLSTSLQEYPPDYVFYAAGINNEQSFISFKTTFQARLLVRVGGLFLPLIKAIGPLRRYFFNTIGKASGAADPEHLNLKMLQNVCSAALQANPNLAHISMVTGGKYYGVHLGPQLYSDWNPPFHEELPRSPGPNFYFEQEDYLKSLTSPTLSWSIVRPHFIMGYSRFSLRNLMTTLAVYGSLMKESNSKLIFPGDQKAWERQQELSDARAIAAIMAWSAEKPEAANEAFNAINEAPVQWKTLWPVLAEALGMEWEYHPKGFGFTKWLNTHQHLWPGMVKKYGLRENSFTALCNSEFLCKAMIPFWDEEYSREKLKEKGFEGLSENREMIFRYVDELRKDRIIP